MRLGLALPHYGFSMPDHTEPRIAAVVGIARVAEDVGLNSVHVSDHLFLDIAKYGGPAEPYATAEAFALLGAVAAGTERIGLGTLVLCAPFRNPAMLALQVRSLSDASDERFTCGLGAGWYEPEFEVAGIPFEGAGARIDRMREIAAYLKENTEAPIIVGGKGGPRILEAVANDAHGWNVCWRAEPEWVGDRHDALNKVAVSAGRDPESLQVTVGLYTLLGRDHDDLAKRFEALVNWAPPGSLEGVSLEDWAAAGLVGTLDEAAEVLSAFEAAGVSEVIASLGSLPFSVYDVEQIALLGELAQMVR